jgi:hypothetical protein
MQCPALFDSVVEPLEEGLPKISRGERSNEAGFGYLQSVSVTF